ncbi:hypothetical protein ERO13_D05G236550v2 [Gossypium hirsutum]|nr:hypothetical protein ERO13_D05G236550v2 [Gossypium hirsutum]
MSNLSANEDGGNNELEMGITARIGAHIRGSGGRCPFVQQFEVLISADSKDSTESAKDLEIRTQKHYVNNQPSQISDF